VVAGFARRFPAALTVRPPSLVCDDDEPCPSSCAALGVDRLDPARFEAATNPVTRWPESELGLRTITGLLRDAAVLATTFLPVVAAPFSPVAGRTGGGGGISASDAADGWVSAAGSPAAGSGSFGAGEEDAGAVPCLCFTDKGSGGGGIAETVAAAVPVDMVSPSWMASSPEAGGDANRAVGRGPDEDGPLDFFKIGCGGGGLEDDGVSPFLPMEGTDPCPELSCGD
jgi:hypothetical protein